MTLAGFGIWWLVDVIVVLAGKATDKSKKPLSGYRQHRTVAFAVTAGFVAVGIIGSSIAGTSSTDRRLRTGRRGRPAVRGDVAR